MIHIEGLSVSYGTLRAVDDLSLHIPEGSMYGLLGPNGAGKSTTISCVAGLLSPARGRIRVGGVDVAREPEQVKRKLGVVPQSIALYPTLTVTQNLRIFGGIFGLRGQKLRERVQWGLALAQLEGKRQAVVSVLSGGMKRRLNLACAMLHDPPVIVCDEPTTGVDPQSRNHLFETLRTLHAEGRTIVYTTHYLEEVEALCDRVAIIDRGQVIRDSSLTALLAATGPPRRFEVGLAAGRSLESVRASLTGAGLPVEQVAETRRSLEEVFLDLTGRELRDAS